MGYPYGPDAIVLNASLKYEQLGKWNIEGSLFYMAHGTHDRWTVWSKVYNQENVGENKPPKHTTPTTSHDTENHKYGDVENRNSVSHTFSAGIRGSINLINSLQLYTEVDYILITNPNNNNNNRPISDVQLTLGLSYAL